MSVKKLAAATHLRQRPPVNSIPGVPSWRECAGMFFRLSVARLCRCGMVCVHLFYESLTSSASRFPSSPTADGHQLACCGTAVQPQCENNAACKALGLGDLCCPTVDNVFLDCCTALPDDCQEPGKCDAAPVNATCELNPQCDALNLEGVCCPSKLPLGRGCAFYTSTTTAHFSHR